VKVSRAIDCIPDDHRTNLQKSTLRNYGVVLNNFHKEFSDKEAETLDSEEILTFLMRYTRHA
jgi:hypothetical protein